MNYKDFVYFDIETAGSYPDLESFKNNDIRGYDLFSRKCERKSENFQDWKSDISYVYTNKSPLMPEFGRIVCVSVAILRDDNMSIRSIMNDDEEKLIIDTHKIFSNISKKTTLGLSGYYIKGFDIPWLNRKFLKYNLEIPRLFKTINIKPWDMNILDLSEAWKNYGSLENVSLDEMLYTLNIKSPKNIMSGKDVHYNYWIKKDVDKIKKYCESDVISCIEASKKITQLL